MVRAIRSKPELYRICVCCFACIHLILRRVFRGLSLFRLFFGQFVRSGNPRSLRPYHIPGAYAPGSVLNFFVVTLIKIWTMRFLKFLITGTSTPQAERASLHILVHFLWNEWRRSKLQCCTSEGEWENGKNRSLAHIFSSLKYSKMQFYGGG
jgi:hypothetical protein